MEYQDLPINSISFSIRHYGEELATYFIVKLSLMVEEIVAQSCCWKEDDFIECVAHLKYLVKVKTYIGTDNKEFTTTKKIKLITALNNLDLHIKYANSNIDEMNS